MKKILLPVLIVLAYLGAAYYTGLQAEQHMRAQVALSQQQAELQGTTVTLADYQRGVLTSQFTLIAEIPVDVVDGGMATVTLDTEVMHGPLIIDDGLHVGLFRARSQTLFSTEDAEASAFIEKLFGGAIGEMTLQGQFDGSYTLDWVTDPVTYSEGAGRVSVEGFTLQAFGHFDSLDSEGSFNLGAVDVQADDFSMVLSPVTGNMAMQVYEDRLPLTDLVAEAESLQITGAGSPPVVMSGLRYEQTQDMVDGYLNAQVRMAVDRVESTVRLDNLFYQIDVNGMPEAAMEAWAVFSRDMQTKDTINNELLNRALVETLQEDATLGLSLGSEVFDGRVRADLQLASSEAVSDRVLTDVTEPVEFVDYLVGELELRVSQQVITESILAMFLAQYIDTLLVADGDDYVFRAKLEEGIIRFGDTELPHLLQLMQSVMPGRAPAPQP